MKIAFATCAAWPEGRLDDQLVAQEVGATFEIWDAPDVAWHAYDRVIIRSVWDYSHRRAAFLRWCEAAGAQRLRNVPALVAFNTDKIYLERLPVPTIPTIVVKPGQAVDDNWGYEVVVKPNISAGGRDTGRFQPDARSQAIELIREIHASGRAALIQPYLPGVDSEGETAVVFLGGGVSHVLRKAPVLRAPGLAPLADIAYGPAAIMLDEDLVTLSEASPEQLELAKRAHADIASRFGTPLYARIDMVPGFDGEPLVIELELTEPNLYLDLAPGAVERFTRVITTDAAR
ncbi:MAG: ATP-grasp domain-containing protein [Solirubrobacteraceae bacterium]